MTETTTNTAASPATKAAKAVSEAVTPTVVETVEVALEVPAKVALNQKAVVAVSLLVGMSLGAGVLYGVNKWQENRKNKSSDKVEVPNDLSELEDEARKS